MKKLGFTLAEILITLGIIGVVAALTAPALVKNTGNAKIGPTLSKFVNTFETACEQMMYHEYANSITQIVPCNEDGVERCMGAETLQAISKYMTMAPLSQEQSDAYCMYPENGANGDDEKKCGSEQSVIWQLKDGSIIGINNYLDSYNAKESFKGDIGEIFIDINGVGGNNRAGKEVFAFKLDNSGILVPVGSKIHLHLNENASTYEPNSSDIYKSLALTGKFADNNWKLN